MVRKWGGGYQCRNILPLKRHPSGRGELKGYGISRGWFGSGEGVTSAGTSCLLRGHPFIPLPWRGTALA
ncbi:MAG: hypothetical protein Q4E67_08255, partial [Planctomycetia bacterium]|nr:hypothetical protein [Planctomycetia bacterium]